MNDFTKEELFSISDCLRMAYKSGFDAGNDLPTAYHCYDKIQSMIDNYCDHTWTDGGGNIIHCGKCGVYK
jgi:hypothetical protein